MGGDGNGQGKGRAGCVRGVGGARDWGSNGERAAGDVRDSATRDADGVAPRDEPGRF
jgi:hypothetical protein